MLCWTLFLSLTICLGGGLFGKQSVTVDSILSCNIDTAMSFSDLDGYLDDLDSCAYYLRCLSGRDRCFGISHPHNYML